MAEGRGKAQADTLRKARRDIHGAGSSPRRSATPPSRRVASADLRTGRLRAVEAGEFIPGDGEVIEGVASVDESAITGESAPVIRESGGDRSAVTGGTRVLSDWLIIRVTANPGESFLDRMISMVEGAKRQKTPERNRAEHPPGGADASCSWSSAPRCCRISIYSVKAAGTGAVVSDHGAGCAVRLPGADDHRRAALGHRHRRHGPPDPGQLHRDVRPRGRSRRRRGRAAARQDRHDHAGQPPGDGIYPGRRRRPAGTGRRGAVGLAGRRDARGPQHRRARQGEVRSARPRNPARWARRSSRSPRRRA